jgi:hypothetical protein
VHRSNVINVKKIISIKELIDDERPRYTTLGVTFAQDIGTGKKKYASNNVFCVILRMLDNLTGNEFITPYYVDKWNGVQNEIENTNQRIIQLHNKVSDELIMKGIIPKEYMYYRPQEKVIVFDSHAGSSIDYMNL